MQVPRAAAACADREPARQRGVGRRRERRRLLVTDVLPSGFAGATDRVGEAVEAVTRQTVDTAHAADR
jgi:hypothetical protein